MYAAAPTSRVQVFSRSTLDLAALDDHLSDAEIAAVCTHLGHGWRCRVFTPAVTVRSIVYRGLYPDKSIDALLADMAASAPWADAPTDAAWCQARDRLPEAVLTSLVEGTAARVIGRHGRAHLWCGRPVYRFDGTTISMPDTGELAAHFGYANTKHGLSRFPVARVAVWIAAGPEVICHYRVDPFGTDERVQFRASWDCLPRGAICVCDVQFSSFYDLAKLSQRGVDVITPLHQRRDPNKLIAAGKKIGPNQWLVPLKLDPQIRKQYNDPSLPQTLWVRLIRVKMPRTSRRKRLWLVTTLLDAQRYDVRTVAALYLDRWVIETRIGTFKITLAAKILRSTTVESVEKELAGRVLAYNLVWTVIHDAAAQADVPADRVGFKDAVRIIIAYSTALRGLGGSQRQYVYTRMLAAITMHINPRRPGRNEPRLVKREQRRYGFLKQPREKARLPS